jgi:hypothetical protein
LEYKEMQRRVGSAIRVVGLTAVLGGASLAHAAEPPALVALVLDTSGSVGEADLARTRDLALGILGSLPPGSEVAVLTFDDQSRVVQPRTANPEEVKTALSQARIAGRYTALYDALYDASRYLKEAPRARKAIILITDGLDENSSLQVEDGLKVAVENKIPVYCVGIGKIQEAVLRRIAKLTSGEYQPLAATSGAALAGKIKDLPEPEPAVAPAQPTPVAAAPVEVAAAPATSAWLYVVAAVLVLGLGLVVFGLLRSKPLPRGRVSDPGARTVSRAIEPIDYGDDEGGGDRTVVMRTSNVEQVERTMMLRLQPRLIITRGTGEGQIFNLSGESALSIGRAPTNDIPLNDTAVSGEHCRVRPEEGAFVLHDLKSTNGTFVNEKRVTRHRLSEGDVVRVGETQIQFTLSP